MAKIHGEDIASKSQDLAYFHSAIFGKSTEHKVLASCVTFASESRVPPGAVYNVSALHKFLVEFSSGLILGGDVSKCHRGRPYPLLHLQQ